MHPKGWETQAAYNILTGTWLDGGTPFELNRCGQTEAGAIRYFSEKAGVWMTLDVMLRHAINTGSSLSEYHVYPKNRRQKLLLARILGDYMASAEGYPTNISLSGNGMIFTNKQIIDQDSYFWVVDRFQMTDIPEDREEQVRKHYKMQPEHWYSHYDKKRVSIPRRARMIKREGSVLVLCTIWTMVIA